MEDMNKQSKRFYEIIDVIKNLHDQKRHDYGANDIYLLTFDYQNCQAYLLGKVLLFVWATNMQE